MHLRRQENVEYCLKQAWDRCATLKYRKEGKNYANFALFSDLARMYNLLNRIEHGLEPLINLLENHIVSQGTGAIQSIAQAAMTVSLFPILDTREYFFI